MERAAAFGRRVVARENMAARYVAVGGEMLELGDRATVLPEDRGRRTDRVVERLKVERA